MSLPFDDLAHLFPPSSPLHHNNAWTCILGPVLLAFAHEHLIADLASYILSTPTTSSSPDQTLTTLRSLRESLLKSSPLVGFPRAINALTLLATTLKHQSPSLQATLAHDPSLRTQVPLSTRYARGTSFFHKIYAHHTDRILNNLNESSGGELGEFAINCVYGDLVAETRRLGERETGLVEFGVCLAMGVGAQAKGFMYGARNLGTERAEVGAVVGMVRKVGGVLGVGWGEGGMGFLSKMDEEGW